MSDESEKLYNQAVDAIQSGQLEKAISSVEEALTADPADVPSWQLYVNLLNAAGRTEDASKAKEKLMSMGISELDELMIEAAENLADGNIDAAIATYQKAVEFNPDDADVHSSLAMALFQSGDKEAALAAGRQAVELAPDDSRSNYGLGHMLRLTGNMDEALDALTKAIEAEPDFMPALYEQGMLLAEKGRFEAALKNFEKFGAAYPDDQNAQVAIASIKKELGKTDTF